MSDTPNNNGGNSPPTDQPGYLYHQQKPPAPPRRRRAPRPSDFRTFQQPSQPGEKLFQSNVKRFLVVIVGMAVIFALALFIAVESWRAKQAHQRSPSRPRSSWVTASTNFQRRAPSRDELQRLGRAASADAADGEAIRRAVMLAKHARELENQGQFMTALDRYYDALEQWPRLLQVRARVARLHLALKEYAKAEEAMKLALEEDPRSPGLLNDLGVCRFLRSDPARARESFEAALQIDPRLMAAHYNLSLCQVAQNDRAGARASLSIFLAAQPDDPKALKQLAYIDAADGSYTQALLSVQAALRAAPDSAALYADAAALMALMDRTTDALDFLRKAESLSSPVEVFTVYQQPAFQKIHPSDAGRQFERELVEQSRKGGSGGKTNALINAPPEPILAEPPL